MGKTIRDLVVGKDKFIDSYCEFKRIMLSGHFALIGILVLTVYMGIDILTQTFETIPVYLFTMTMLGISLVFHRKGKHCRANYFLLPTVSITVYLFASSESPNTGSFIMFISTSLAAFAVFGYKQRLLSILFVVFTYSLFILAYFIDFSILPKRNYSDDMMLLNVIINFSVALTTSVMVVYLMIRLNHYNSVQLVQSNKLLVKTNEELDRFVYSTSHDLRAPLASVLGLIDIANRNADTGDVKQYLGMMKERVSSLDKFIRDITDYSRNNRIDVIKEKIGLADLVQEVWETLKHSPEAIGITFQIEIPNDAEIVSDKNRLRIVLTNLIANSIRYHDNRKLIKYIRLRYQINGKSFYIKVEDNGQGIHPDYQAKVFDMFYRASENSKGSGLGLYIVKETMSKLAGSVHLDSAPGVGTTFVVKIPY